MLSVKPYSVKPYIVINEKSKSALPLRVSALRLSESKNALFADITRPSNLYPVSPVAGSQQSSPRL